MKWTRPQYQPSFYNKVDYRKHYWRDLVGRKGIEEPFFPEFTKLQSRAVAQAAKAKVPQLLDGPVSADVLQLDLYGDDFVVKPDWGASSVGVLVLHRSNDRYVDSISGNSFDDESIRAFYNEILGPGKRGDPRQLLVEECLSYDGVRPDEWKVFAFHGRIGVVQQMKRVGREISIKLYDSRGRDLGQLRGDHKFDDALAVSPLFEEVIETAKRVSLQVPTGFIRVDFFDTVREGIVLGELCLIPGGDLFFRDGWDRRLGEMWDKGNVDVLAAGDALIP